MTTLTMPRIELDAEGFMTDPNAWTPDIAETLAQKIGITPLTARHWDVINFTRDDYFAKGETPTLRRIMKVGGIPTKELYKLFPKGPAKKVALVSGLGKPKGCI